MAFWVFVLKYLVNTIKLQRADQERPRNGLSLFLISKSIEVYIVVFYLSININD